MVLGRLDYKYPLAGRRWAVAGFLLGVAGGCVFSSVCTPGLGRGLGINLDMPCGRTSALS